MLEVLDGPVQQALAQRRHPMLGSPTLSVGTIRGGTQVNVVPAECQIEIDRRLLPGESPEKAMEQIVACLRAIQDQPPPIVCQWEPLETYLPFEQDSQSPIVKLAEQACRTVLGRPA